MAKKDKKSPKVVNVADPGSVVGIMSGGSVVGNTVTVNGSTVVNGGGGRWIDIEDVDRSLWSDPDNPDY